MKLIQLIGSLALGVVVVEGIKVDELRELNAKFIDIQPQIPEVEGQVQFRNDESNQKNVFDYYQTPVDLLTLPINPKPTSDDVHKVCSLDLLNYGFANSYGKPYLGKYKVPKECIGDGTIVQTVLKIQGDVKGRQFDRFGTLFLSNTELLRFTTAEPTDLGITWKLDKDISDYNDLFTLDGDVYLDLGNLVNEVYTGTIYIKVQVDLYVLSNRYQDKISNPKSVSFNNKTNGYVTISDDTTYYQYFSIKDGAMFSKLELELFYSNHGDDEFYYFNKGYLQGQPPYREIQIYLNEKRVASVWPFISIYTGGITLSLWRPISGLGSFNLPSEKIDLSRYLSALTKGTHSLGVKVVNASAFWLISTNLLLKEPKINNDEYNQIQSLQVDNSSLLNEPTVDSYVIQSNNGDGNFGTVVKRDNAFTYIDYSLRQPYKVVLYKHEQKMQFQQSINFTQQESVNDYELLRTVNTKLTKSIYELNFNFDPNYHKNFNFDGKFLRSSQVLIDTTNQMQFKGRYVEVAYPNNGYKLESDLYLDLNIKSLLPCKPTSAAKGIGYQLEYYKYWGNATAVRKHLTAKAVGINLSEGQQNIKVDDKCFKRSLQAKNGYFVFDKQVRNCEEVLIPEIYIH